MITLIVWILVALAIVCLAFAYVASRNDAAVSAARFTVMTKRVQALSDAVSDFRGAVKKDFQGTDDGVVVAAERTMDVLKDAIHKEAVIVQSTLGENRRAIVALGQLLSKSTQSLRTMLKTLDTEDKAQVMRMINEMEGRHAEIVQYLSGGDMDAAVKNILAELEKDPGVLKAESFSTEKLRAALRAYGVDMDDAALAQLNADLEKDVLSGMSLKDSLYLRMSRIEPIATLSRSRGDQKRVDAEAKVASAFESIQENEASHNDAIKGAIADQYMTQKINAAEVKQTVTKQLAASNAAAKAKLAETTDAVKQTVQQSVASLAGMKARVEGELQKVEAMKLALSKVAPNVVLPAFVPPPTAPAQAARWTATSARPVIWLDGASFKNGVWHDKSGNGNDARTESASVGDFGGMPIVMGGTQSGVEIVKGWPGGDYTFVHVTKYNGGTRGRIWNGKKTNWLSGHWGGHAGWAHHNRWLEPKRDLPVDQWVLTVDQKNFARFNAANEVSAEGSSPSGVGINQFGGDSSNERSDWACAEVVVFEGNLNAGDMRAVEAYLIGKYKLPFQSPTPAPAAAPAPVPASWVRVAGEGGRFDVNGIVRYGTGGTWTQKEFRGPGGCDNGTFGDPVPGTVKECQAMVGGQPPWTATSAKPVIWLDGESFKNGVWSDKSGRGNDAPTSNVSVETFNGRPVLRGDTGAGADVSKGWPSGEFTFVHLTKYNGGSRGRIWNGKQTNWLSGHWAGNAGWSHHDRWISQQSKPLMDWLLTVTQRSWMRYNADNVATGEGTNPRGVGINQFGGAHNNERSDWACAEVIVFEGNLADADMKAVESYMIQKYKLPFKDPGSGARLAGKLMEQKYRGYYNDNLDWFANAPKDGASAQVTTIKKGDEGSQYSYRWVGKIKPRASGDHEFWTRSDDASHVRINGRVVVDNGGVHAPQDKSGRLDLNADTTYDFEVLFGENEGGAEMWLQWHGPGQGWQSDLAQILV